MSCEKGGLFRLVEPPPIADPVDFAPGFGDYGPVFETRNDVFSERSLGEHLDVAAPVPGEIRRWLLPRFVVKARCFIAKFAVSPCVDLNPRGCDIVEPVIERERRRRLLCQVCDA